MSPTCRACGEPLTVSMCDLGMSPLCESFLRADQLNAMEPFYPLHLRVCGGCYLAQLEEYVSPEALFSEYAYFSSYSDTWLDHARRYTDLMIERFALGAQSHVVELASNDGYLLRWFVARAVPCLGIEPAANVAAAATAAGVPTRVAFFTRDYAARLVGEGLSADLVAANNVLAQVTDLRGFVGGIRTLLKVSGVATLEFPHVVRLMAGNQFDTIYHEHFSYFSLYSIEKLFAAEGLTVFDVEQLHTHGGSLRIYAGRADAGRAAGERVAALRAEERRFGIDRMERYRAFDQQARATKLRLLALLIDLKAQGKQIVGYGAPGKGNTLLNYCAIRTDFLDYTCDRNPYKHGRFLPGTHIPIHAPEQIQATRPDYVMILPWNLKHEVMAQLSYIRAWNGKFIVAIPEPQVIA